VSLTHFRLSCVIKVRKKYLFWHSEVDLGPPSSIFYPSLLHLSVDIMSTTLLSTTRSSGARLFIRRQSSPSVWPPTTTTASVTKNSKPTIQRHGPGDKVITLNVGGKQFQTLRSTIAQNSVLYDHVLRAEANMEYMGASNGSSSSADAVFIDRDPKHFNVILMYLRNKADGLVSDAATSSTSSTLRFGKKLSVNSSSPSSPIHLPTDSNLLSEIYFESLHYDIPEMTDLICSRQWFTRVFKLFGSNNPFKMAGVAYLNMKRLLILSGGVLTGLGGWVYAQAVAAQATTSELLVSNSSGGCDDIGESKSAASFWKNQSKLWSGTAEKWNDLLKEDPTQNKK
jgi:hypothetical protein